ncbi:unnamed protein product [Caenorhabditis angaria]|uniref:FERM domain-containing protein n=1 Tax=Caenorhabditis angaria TaxID=860376 RepID=A0A9P1I3W4_9PELO|nr:unnamed protein product [Caenorhabditis angaria]
MKKLYFANDNAKLIYFVIFCEERWVNKIVYMPKNTSSSSTSSLFGRISTRSSFMSPKDVRCNVHLLHDSDIIGNEFGRSQSAQTVLDYICNMKNVQEKDFLGLRYQDHNKHRYWLDLSRSLNHVVKQFRTESLSLHLRFRYYPTDPARIRDLNLRYQLFVQLQRDLLHGRLYCPQTHAAELAALILQAQLGDFNESEHVGNYVSGYKLLLRQTPKLEERIAILHKSYAGKTTEDAELEFLEKASQLDTYAFDPYTIKDPQDPTNDVYLGASAKGILIYTGTSRAHHIDWSELEKVDYSGRELKITVNEKYAGKIEEKAGEKSPTKKHVGGGGQLKYLCPSAKFAKHLWIHILSQQAFFNEEKAEDVELKFSKPRIPLISRGSTFRFPSRRVYREIADGSGFSSGNEGTHSLIGNDTLNGPDHTHDQTTDTESNLWNTSIQSIPVLRYELPRQEVRKEEPWLLHQNSQKSSTSSNHVVKTLEIQKSDDSAEEEKNNNNNYSKAKLTNLNISFASEPSPSTSEEASIPVPTYISTVKLSPDQNSNSNTNGEGISNSKNQGGILEQQNLEENFESPGAPLATSTPRTIKNPILSNGNGKIMNGYKITSTTTTTSPSVSATEKIEKENSSKSHVAKSSSANSSSLLGKVTNSLFIFFLLFLLTIAVIICVFERSETSGSDWIEKNRQLSQFRHIYYDPTRHFVIDQYRKYFGTKI